MPLRIHLDSPLSPTLQFLSHLGRIIFWVTLGAAALMLAQVMIPNFRKCLALESRIESLQEDLRAIDSSVGSRLYTRCQQEINGVRRGLALRQNADGSAWWMPLSNSSGRIWSRFALTGNTTEVDRLSAIVPRIESRIRLTQRLNERESVLSSDSGEMPPSLCWNREEQLLAVQEILAGQVIADADETNASRILDQLVDDATATKDFAEQLERRAKAMKTQFAAEPWKSMSAGVISSLNGCAELLAESAAAPPAELTSEQRIFRDTCVIRLEILSRLIGIGALSSKDSKIPDGILERLRSMSPGRLASARTEVLKLSESIFDEQVKDALEKGMWDPSYEPVDPTDQDVIRMSLRFRDEELNRSTARNGFQCYWQIVTEAEQNIASGTKKKVVGKTKTAKAIETPSQAGSVVSTESAKPESEKIEPGEGYYEQGWEAQFILPPGDNIIKPIVQDRCGAKIQLLNEQGKVDDPLHVQVGQPRSSTLYSRAVRGLIDASITALVPVFTVAFTQFQNGGDLTVVKLILLGFTSQAIRSAVLPESVSPGLTKESPKPGGATGTSSA